MDDLFYCIRIMQISTEKLQSTQPSESLRRSALIRSTFVQTRKHFCDLIHSLSKISSTNNALVPVIRENPEYRKKILSYQRATTSSLSSAQKRKSCSIDVVKRLCLTSANVSNDITSD